MRLALPILCVATLSAGCPSTEAQPAAHYPHTRAALEALGLGLHFDEGSCGNQVCEVGEVARSCPADCDRIDLADYWTYTDFSLSPDEAYAEHCKGKGAAELEAQRAQADLQARALSEALAAYIRAWHRGAAPAELPSGLLPSSMDNDKTRAWKLYRPEEIEARDQWPLVRPAMEVPADFGQLFLLSPDSNCTYMKTLFVAPFGATLEVEGEFGHARFMDLQIVPPFDPHFPTTTGLGAPEVPIVDVDIQPLPGHVNPFVPGANRNAADRSYRVSFELQAGNALELNPEAMVAPAYRAPGNSRVGGPMVFTGPRGDNTIAAATLWLRYYAPDREAGPLAGVGYPALTMRLDTGEAFWLQPDASLVTKRWGTGVPGHEMASVHPPRSIGGSLGWLPIYGFWLIYAEGAGFELSLGGKLLPGTWKDFIQERDRCFFSRGPDQPPPGSYQHSASSMNYHAYLVRPLWLGQASVYALEGRLPRTPHTRNGEPIATAGEARYWSLCHAGSGEGGKYPGLLYGCLMDDEIVTDDEDRYVVVYTRAAERPRNARPECGVTWQAWGPESKQALNLRWTSVHPDEVLQEYVPDERKLPWARGAWSQHAYDPTLTGANDHDGAMGPYQPVFHYLPVEAFEALGCPVAADGIPPWR